MRFLKKIKIASTTSSFRYHYCRADAVVVFFRDFGEVSFSMIIIFNDNDPLPCCMTRTLSTWCIIPQFYASIFHSYARII